MLACPTTQPAYRAMETGTHDLGGTETQMWCHLVHAPPLALPDVIKHTTVALPDVIKHTTECHPLKTRDSIHIHTNPAIVRGAWEVHSVWRLTQA